MLARWDQSGIGESVLILSLLAEDINICQAVSREMVDLPVHGQGMKRYGRRSQPPQRLCSNMTGEVISSGLGLLHADDGLIEVHERPYHDLSMARIDNKGLMSNGGARASLCPLHPPLTRPKLQKVLY